MNRRSFLIMLSTSSIVCIGGLKVAKALAKDNKLYNPEEIFEDARIVADKLSNSTITSAKLANLAVGVVSADKIAAGSIAYKQLCYS